MSRVKKRIRYCKEHGPFISLAWNGHRRHCRAPQVSKQEYEREARSTKPTSVLPTTPASEPVRSVPEATPLPAPRELPIVPNVDALTGAIKKMLDQLDITIVDLTKKLNEAKANRVRLISSIKSLVK